jgi:hypothetical protein
VKVILANLRGGSKKHIDGEEDHSNCNQSRTCDAFGYRNCVEAKNPRSCTRSPRKVKAAWTRKVKAGSACEISAGNKRGWETGCWGTAKDEPELWVGDYQKDETSDDDDHRAEK